MPIASVLRIGGMPWRMFISIGTASETPAPASFTFCQLMSDIPVMWMNRLSATELVGRGQRVERSAPCRSCRRCAPRSGIRSSRPMAQAASKPGR